MGDFREYRISANQKKMLVSGGGSFGIIDLPNSKIDLKEKLNLSDLRVRLDRHAEWSQMYNECWRQMRDFVYDPNLHGVDWPAIREQYAPLLTSVQHRTDLTYIIGEMIGELNLGHCYVGGGDFPKLNASRSVCSEPTLTRTRPRAFIRSLKSSQARTGLRVCGRPSRKIGVNVKLGDYIIAVDGKPRTKCRTSISRWKARRTSMSFCASIPNPDRGSARRNGRSGQGRAELYYWKWISKNIEDGQQSHRRPGRLRARARYASARAQRFR